MKKIISALLTVCLVFSFSVFAQARLVGDVNNSGDVNSSDALEVLTYSVGLISKIDELRADVNGDKLINSSDALIILQISVGSYSGDLEIDDDEPVKTLKGEIVDPIIQSGCFTISTTVISNGTSIPSVIMVKGNNMSTDLSYGKLSFRLLILDGKCYLILPTLKLYSEATNVTVPTVSFAPSAKETFVKSENYELNGTTYIRETYSYDDGSVRVYYFLDGVWKAVETTVDGETSTQRINSLTPGVTESNFSLAGYTKTDLSKYL